MRKNTKKLAALALAATLGATNPINVKAADDFSTGSVDSVAGTTNTNLNTPIEFTIYYDNGNSETLQGNPEHPDLIQYTIEQAKMRGSHKIIFKIPEKYTLTHGINVSNIDVTFEGDKDNPAIIYKDYIPQNKYQSPFYNSGLSNITFKNIIFQDKTEKTGLTFFGEEDGVLDVCFVGCTTDIPLELRHCSEVNISGSTFNNIDSSHTKDITFANSSIKKIKAKGHLNITLKSVKNLDSLNLQDVYGLCSISESNLPIIYTDNIEFCKIYRSSISGFIINDSNVKFDCCYFSSKHSSDAYKCGPNNLLSFYDCKTRENHASIESPTGEKMNIPINTLGAEISSDSEGNMTKNPLPFVLEKPNYTELKNEKTKTSSSFKQDLKIRNKHPFVKAIQQDEAAYRRTSTDGRGV